MDPNHMDEVLRHTTPTIVRVQDHIRPETKALILKANELLATWQEQEKASERAWDESSKAHDAFMDLCKSRSRTAEELQAAYDRWQELSKFAQSVPSCFEAQREWNTVRSKAQVALAEDAGLLRSDEDIRWEKQLADRAKEEEKEATNA